ncbi:hypothetical protein GCM10009131_24920 [Morganella psychrotolerans]
MCELSSLIIDPCPENDPCVQFAAHGKQSITEIRLQKEMLDIYPAFFDTPRIFCVMCHFGDITCAVQSDVSDDIHKSVTKVTHNRGTV